ncbi:conjugal transfer protein TraH [Candidatus Tisiphia endosymbiont of Nemotelus uliginosus]|uniref:conjugal transfer protein TraH n=1 Tax=Candidatus Tisiphia endosymbiont of Nemotelus uliginosus TaxID=3077926 RepID=UPI0035CA5B8F
MIIRNLIQKLSIHCLLAICLLVSSNSYAGIEKLIKSVMPNGTMSNVSKSAIVHDQLAGHIIGGSVLIKSPPIEDLQLVNFQAPSCKFGGLPCGAQIDLRGGALSFLKSAAMEQFLKEMVQNVGGYAAIMAIKTICPQCENIMTYLEQMQRNINQFNINSCDIATQISNGIASRMNKGAELTRQSDLAMTRGGSDMADIRDKARKDNGDPTKSNKELESLLGDNFNLVWKALTKKASSGGDATSFKELLMSISGTIIGKKDGEGRRSIIHKKSLVNKELIEEFIGIRSGSVDVEQYRCDETNLCLFPQKAKTRLSASDTLYGSIDDMLVSMVKKIKTNNGDFTEEEENLIALSSIPLTNKIQRELATNADSSYLTVRMAEFVETLCYDVVTNYLTKLLQQTSEAVSELAYSQLADIGVFTNFEQEVNNTISFLVSSRENAFRRYNIIEQTKMRMLQEEKYFEMKFQEFMSTNDMDG